VQQSLPTQPISRSVRTPAAQFGSRRHVAGWWEQNRLTGWYPGTASSPFAPSLDTIGPLARDTETTFRGLNAIAGEDLRDPTTRARNLDTTAHWRSLADGATVGLPATFFDRSDDAVAAAVRSAVESSGLRVTPVELPLGRIEQAYFLIGATEFVWFFDQTGVIRGQGPEYTTVVQAFIEAVKSADIGEHVAGRLLGSAALDAETGGKAYRAARQEATDFTERVNHAFSDVDALVMPTIRTLAPERDKMDTTEDMLTLLGNTAPFNIAGTPPQPSLSPKWTASPSARKSSLRGSEILPRSQSATASTTSQQARETT